MQNPGKFSVSRMSDGPKRRSVSGADGRQESVFARELGYFLTCASYENVRETAGSRLALVSTATQVCLRSSALTFPFNDACLNRRRPILLAHAIVAPASSTRSPSSREKALKLDDDQIYRRSIHRKARRLIRTSRFYSNRTFLPRVSPLLRTNIVFYDSMHRRRDVWLLG